MLQVSSIASPYISRSRWILLQTFSPLLSSGVCLEPITFDKAKQLIENGTVESLGALGRSPLELKRYWNYRDTNIKPHYCSVTDYLYTTVFGLNSIIMNDEKDDGSCSKIAAIVPDNFNKTEVLVWRENDFGYYFEDGVFHHVLWSSRPLSADRLAEEVRRRRIDEGYEAVWFVNPPVLMSVPGLWHAHIISRKKKKE